MLDIKVNSMSNFSSQFNQYTESRRFNFEHSKNPNSVGHFGQSVDGGAHYLQDSDDNPSCCYRCCGNLKLLDNSLQVCELPLFGGIPLHIHYFWPVFLLLSVLLALRISFVYALYTFILFGPILFLTVLVHELGHVWMALKLGGSVRAILLWPLGGLAYISLFGESNPKADALVALAGPSTHFFQIGFWILLLMITNGGHFQLNWPMDMGWDLVLCLFAGAVVMQIALFLFNLIPAFPLDGGRVLGAVLACMHVERVMALKITAMVGLGIGFMLLLHGLSTATRSAAGGDFSGANLVALSVFIIYSCYRLYQQALRSEDLTSIPGLDYVRVQPMPVAPAQAYPRSGGGGGGVEQQFPPSRFTYHSEAAQPSAPVYYQSTARYQTLGPVSSRSRPPDESGAVGSFQHFQPQQPQSKQASNPPFYF